MNINDQFINKMVSLGTLSYSFHKCVNVLDVSDDDLPDFTAQWQDGGSRIAKAYKKGIDQADYAIDLKLFEKARAGDLKALETFERRKFERQ